MAQLVHLIYCSAAARPFSRSELMALLATARANNVRGDVTGMLLYAEGSFFQVLEGAPETIEGIFTAIQRDKRHQQITVIIKEPIAKRVFADWTMGYAALQPKDVESIIGVNDFFASGRSFAQLDSGRAKKLLAAFKQGRWRTTLTDGNKADGDTRQIDPAGKPTAAAGTKGHRWYSFAFQPIVHVEEQRIFSYEALIRGRHNESAASVLSQVQEADRHFFDERTRTHAIALAAKLGLTTRLNLNFLPLSLQTSPTAVSSVLDTAEKHNIQPDQIVLEILEKEIISDMQGFTAALSPYRGSGMTVAIDDFGSGYAGLNLLADFQPHIIKLDMHLVRGIHERGPRQAIVSGILHTCRDLGIDIIAEGVETRQEYRWLRDEGILLYQGLLFAPPAFEELPATFHMPA